MGNQLTRIAREILAIEEDLPYRFDYKKQDRVSINDFELYTFDQVWGSTALGFGGVGGQAMTTARTYVLVPEDGVQNCFIYFAGKYAYEVPYSDVLMADIQRQSMEPVSKKGKYITKVEANE